MEQLSLRDEESLKRMYMDTQRNVREHFKQLKEAYERREQLWTDLQNAMEKTGMCSVLYEKLIAQLYFELYNVKLAIADHLIVTSVAARTLASLSSLPAELDDTIATIEKKSKDVSKSTGVDGKARQKLLRDLLAEM